MAASNFKHLEYLPLDEDNLILSSDPESNIKSKSCLNLGFIAFNSISRIQNIIQINNNSSTEYNSFLDFSYSIESILGSLLILNTISNPQNTEITPHYKKYQTVISSRKILPSFSYCQNLIYSSFKTWAGLYGTSQYYINLKETYEEYLSISELAYNSIQELYKYSINVSYNNYLNTKDQNYLLLHNLYKDLSLFINNNSIEADRSIYNFSKLFITSIPLINNTYTELNFYKEWLKEVVSFISTKPIKIINQPKNNKEAAKNTIGRVVQEIRELGINVDNIENIDSKFIRQSLSYNIVEMCTRLKTVRKESTFLNIQEEQAALSTEEILVNKFHKAISINRIDTDYFSANSLILSSFCPPGGYALLLVSLAITLLNRAYIIAYLDIKSKETLEFSSSYKRSIKLIGYSAILLIKTGLPHLQAFGINLLRSYNLNITNIEPNNLLDIY